MFMETRCHSANATAATKKFVVAMMAFCLAIARVRAEEGPSEDGGMLCVSKCGTCPVICSQSPPPPSPSQIYIIHTSPPPPRSENNLPPPSPPPPKSSSSQPTPPAGEKPHGGLSYPYYYFYTADAPKLFVSSISLWFLALLIYFLNLV